MTILHICNDFAGSKVHTCLYEQLDKLLDRQIVYTYFDGQEKINKNKFTSEKTEFIYDDILNSYLRKVYPLKQWWVCHNLIKKINPSEIDCIHATTLFSDGGIAYKLYKKYGIPYVVAVRTTDLGTYLNRTKITWPYGRRVLLNAKIIILINKSFENKLRTHEFSKDIWDVIKNKIVVQPNGIDDYWIKNISREPKIQNFNICYVGTFIKRKNVPRLIEAVDVLHKDFPQVHLNLIGGGGLLNNEDELVKSMANERPYVSILGRITDKNVMREQYRENSIYAMPSWSETFGLVYIEALTQNVRLLYSKNDGIDGLLDNVGIAVDPFSVDSIVDGLRKLLLEYESFDGNKKVDFSLFDWNSIANRYHNIYTSIVNNVNKK